MTRIEIEFFNCFPLYVGRVARKHEIFTLPISLYSLTQGEIFEAHLNIKQQMSNFFNMGGTIIDKQFLLRWDKNRIEINHNVIYQTSDGEPTILFTISIKE